jgi:hypothetical protein
MKKLQRMKTISLNENVKKVVMNENVAGCKKAFSKRRCDARQQ